MAKLCIEPQATEWKMVWCASTIHGENLRRRERGGG
jgi:hypothetical protein